MSFETILGRERASLLLLHPTSLPDPEGQAYGIGELGSEAMGLIDALTETGTLAWQVLPLGHTGFKDSPYQTFSRFAGSPLLVSIEDLLETGDLTQAEHDAYCDGVRRHGAPAEQTDYGWIFENKVGREAANDRAVLRKAYAGFRRRSEDDARRQAFARFRDAAHAGDVDWLDEYADYSAIKQRHDQRAWTEWPAPFRDFGDWKREREAILSSDAELAETIEFFQYLQFVFHEQWQAVRRHARDQGRLLIGDIPWYVGHDSADVWAHREVFDLTPDGAPVRVAGVPPDAFSDTGQLWGNPLYNWDAAETLQWWVRSVSHILGMVDILRIDHFRAIDTYWVVPTEWAEEEQNAMGGHWERGPGRELLEALREGLGGYGQIGSEGQLPLIAEDLGCLDPVYASPEEYPTKVARKSRYRVAESFAQQIRDHDPELAAALDPKNDEYDTRRGVDAALIEFGLPWMDVLQFVFLDPSPYRPERVPRDSVTYSGTHDNDTTLGWYWDAVSPDNRDEEPERNTWLRDRIQKALVPPEPEEEDEDNANGAEEDNRGDSEQESEETEPLPPPNRALFEAAFASNSCLAGAPLQDWLGLGSQARMNLPGDSDHAWWTWRATREQVQSKTWRMALSEINERHGRFAPADAEEEKR